MRCRVCGCSEREPCNPPCSWAEAELCSECDEAIDDLVAYREAARRYYPRRLLKEVEERSR